MKELIRRLRGALGIGLTWAALWVVLGSVLMLVIGIVDPDQIDPGEGPAKALPILALVGFLSGLAFSGCSHSRSGVERSATSRSYARHFGVCSAGSRSPC